MSHVQATNLVKLDRSYEGLGPPMHAPSQHDGGDLATIDFPGCAIEDLAGCPDFPSGLHRSPASAVLRDPGHELGLVHNDKVATLVCTASNDGASFVASRAYIANM